MKFTATLVLFSVLFSINLKAQGNIQNPKKTRNLIGWYHEKNVNINGLSFGIYSLSNIDRNTTTNGIKTEFLGAGLFTFFFGARETCLDKDISRKSLELQSIDYSEKINGISISTFGSVGKINVNGIGINGIGCHYQKFNGILFNGTVCHMRIHNGLLVSGMFNSVDSQRGVSLCAFYNRINNGKGLIICAIKNKARYYDGIQISLFNETKSGRLIQFGLLNYIGDNPKLLRYLPFVNMRFKKNL